MTVAIYALKPRFRQALAGVADQLADRGVSADQVTGAGVLAAGVGALAMLASRRRRAALLLVPVCAGVRITANALDGLVAERTHGGRPEGELFNEVADRVGDTLLIGGTAAIPGVGIAAPAVALAAAEFASFVGVTAKAAGATRRYDGPMGKPDRMAVVSVTALAAAFGVPGKAVRVGLGVIALGAIATAANRYRQALLDMGALDLTGEDFEDGFDGDFGDGDFGDGDAE